MNYYDVIKKQSLLSSKVDIKIIELASVYSVQNIDYFIIISREIIWKIIIVIYNKYK